MLHIIGFQSMIFLNIIPVCEYQITETFDVKGVKRLTYSLATAMIPVTLSSLRDPFQLC